MASWPTNIAMHPRQRKTNKKSSGTSANATIWTLCHLVGGFNPFKTILVKMWIFPKYGVKIQNIWNHHLVMKNPSWHATQQDLPIISVARGPGLFSKISSIAQIQATRLQEETQHVVCTARLEQGTSSINQHGNSYEEIQLLWIYLYKTCNLGPHTIEVLSSWYLATCHQINEKPQVWCIYVQGNPWMKTFKKHQQEPPPNLGPSSKDLIFHYKKQCMQVQ